MSDDGTDVRQSISEIKRDRSVRRLMMSVISRSERLRSDIDPNWFGGNHRKSATSLTMWI